MLEEDAVVLLVDTDGVLDCPHSASLSWEMRINIVDRALAITPQGEAVRHVATAILAEIESMLSVMGALWLSTSSMLAARPIRR